jgi:hypothetical protein
MKGKGRRTLEITMWLRVCYNMEVYCFVLHHYYYFLKENIDLMCKLAPKRWKYQVPTRVLVHPSTRIQIFQGMLLFCGVIELFVKSCHVGLELHPSFDVSSPLSYCPQSHEILLNKGTWTIISLKPRALNVHGHVALWNFRLCFEPSCLPPLNRTSIWNNLLQLMLANVGNFNNIKR